LHLCGFRSSRPGFTGGGRSDSDCRLGQRVWRTFDEGPSLKLRECVVAAVLDEMSVDGTMGALGDSVVIPVRLVRRCRGRSRSVSLSLTCRGVEGRRVAGSKWPSREECANFFQAAGYETPWRKRAILSKSSGPWLLIWHSQRLPNFSGHMTMNAHPN
jgi:hypothetical protein